MITDLKVIPATIILDPSGIKSKATGLFTNASSLINKQDGTSHKINLLFWVAAAKYWPFLLKFKQTIMSSLKKYNY